MTTSASAASKVSLAATICLSLHRAYRDFRFYPEDHPTARQALTALVESIDTFLGKWGSLCLDVTEDRLWVEGEAVYSHDASRDNLAFLMFRDGVRGFCIHAEVEVAEIEGLVHCLAHADDLAEMEHDLVTALWERDFLHIDYNVADPFLGGEVLAEGLIDSLRDTVIRRLQEFEQPYSGDGAFGSEQIGIGGQEQHSAASDYLEKVGIKLADIELSADDMERSERAIEGLDSVFEEYAETILELAAAGRDIVQNGPLATALVALFTAHLDSLDYVRLEFMLDLIGRWESEGKCQQGFKGFVVGETVTVSHLRRMLHASSQQSADDTKRVLAFIGAIREWAIPLLLDILLEEEERGARKTLLEILESGDGVPWKFLHPLLNDHRWYVVRNAVQLSASSRYDHLVRSAPRLLAHPDVRVRRETLRALERVESKKAVECFVDALSDSESSVRTLAARALSRVGDRSQEPVVRKKLLDRSINTIPAEEAEALFIAYAALGQEEAIPLLDRLWRKRLLANRPVQMRAAVLRALGRVRDPKVQKILAEAAGSGETQIQAAAAGALQQHRGATLVRQF